MDVNGPDDAIFGIDLGVRATPAGTYASHSVAASIPLPADSSPERDAQLPAPLTSLVFGEPRRVGDKTIISAASVQTVHRSPGGTPIYSQTAPVAVIEVDHDGVRINPVAKTRLPVLVWAVTLVWVAYWLLRTLRSWQSKRGAN